MQHNINQQRLMKENNDTELVIMRRCTLKHNDSKVHLY